MPTTTRRRDRQGGGDSAVTTFNPVEAMAAIETKLAEQTRALAAVLPSVMEPDRFMAVVSRAIAKDEKLVRCTPLSIMRAVMDAASIGIEPTGKYGGGYLVPFWNTKQSRYEATLIVGYDGLKDMAYRSGIVSLIEGDVRREKDEWDYVRGYPETTLRHVPAEGERGPILGAWAMVHLRGAPRPLIGYMPADKITQRRKVSRSGTNKDTGAPMGIWLEWEDEMSMKTALRGVLGLAPKSVIDHVAKAFEVEDAGDSLLLEAGPAPAALPAGSRARRRRLRVGAGGVDVEVTGDEGSEGDEPVGTTETGGKPEVTHESTGEANAAGAPGAGEEGQESAVSSDPPQESAGATGLCGDPSPYEGSESCGLPPDDNHPVHKSFDAEGSITATWPRK